MAGRFISTHSVVLVLPMRIAHTPMRGASLRADAAMSRPGGGFTTLSTVAAQGVAAALASPLGTGPNSFAVRQQLGEAGVNVLTPELVGDIGVAIQLIEPDGAMSSVVTAGVESEPSRTELDRLVLQPGDLIHIAASDLANPRAADVLADWGAALPGSVRLVVAVSSSVEQVPIEAWRKLLRRADVVTMNQREADALASIIATHEVGAGIRDLMKPDAALVRRAGNKGCHLQRSSNDVGVTIPAFRTPVADTAGVGDTHIATMCAQLLKGKDIEDALRTANAAAAIAISHESALPVPTQAQIDEILANGVPLLADDEV